METKRYLKELPVKLTPAERATKQDEVLELLDLVDDITEEMKETVKAFREKITKAQKEMTGLRKQLRSDSEKREVQVEERPDFRTQSVTTVRLDTAEVIAERTMRADELQTTMEVVDGGGETVGEVWGLDGEKKEAAGGDDSGPDDTTDSA